MTPDKLTAIGTLLYGPNWKTELGRSLNISKRSIFRYMSGERPIPDTLESALRPIIKDRRDRLDRFLTA